MKVELCQEIERVIACEAIKSLFADDFRVSVFGGEQITLKHNINTTAIEAAMFTTDEDQLHVEHQHVAEEGWVLFIYGNDGHNVVANHMTNLELSLKGVSELADKVADRDPTTLARMLAEIGAQRFWPERSKRCRVVAATATRRLNKPA